MNSTTHLKRKICQSLGPKNVPCQLDEGHEPLHTFKDERYGKTTYWTEDYAPNLPRTTPRIA